MSRTGGWFLSGWRRRSSGEVEEVASSGEVGKVRLLIRERLIDYCSSGERILGKCGRTEIAREVGEVFVVARVDRQMIDWKSLESLQRL